MKRHEYLYSALAAFGAALVFIVFGAVVLHVLNPYLDAAEIGFMFFKMIPIAFIAIGAVFAVIGAYALVNERMIENGEVIGLDVDFAKAICDQMGYKLIVEDMEFDAIIPAVQSGKADFGMAGMTVTPERAESINFTDSYCTGVQSIIVRK